MSDAYNATRHRCDNDRCRATKAALTAERDQLRAALKASEDANGEYIEDAKQSCAELAAIKAPDAYKRLADGYAILKAELAEASAKVAEWKATMSSEECRQTALDYEMQCRTLQSELAAVKDQLQLAEQGWNVNANEAKRLEAQLAAVKSERDSACDPPSTMAITTPIAHACVVVCRKPYP
jgi:chromosome segregation ATPase